MLLLLLLLICCCCCQVFLNMQDRLLSLRGRGSWAQAYYMPTPSDSAVITGDDYAQQTHAAVTSSAEGDRGGHLLLCWCVLQVRRD